MHAIRITDFNGDREEVFFAGPYPDAETRDRELDRLSAMTQLDAGYEFEAAKPAGVGDARRVDPATLTAVTPDIDEDAFADILYA